MKGSDEQTELLRNIWQEMKALGSHLGGRIDRLGSELGQRIDQTNARLERLEAGVDAGFAMVRVELVEHRLLYEELRERVTRLERGEPR